jgi:calcineurin-like phosphoesterase family protein
MTYFISDPHFYHENIIKFCNRPFATAQEMNEVLILNINNTVEENDELYWLGDFGMCSDEEVLKIMRRIVCKNNHYIMGNHDKAMKDPKVRNFFKSIQDYKRIAVQGQDIILFHFPIAEWVNCHRGSWMLHGHSHGTHNYSDFLKDKKIIDVGVDCTNYYPISFDEVKKIMDKRENYTYPKREYQK